VNAVLVTQALIAIATFAINVVVFRELGADGKGAYTLFVLVTTIGSGLTTLGVGLANLYFLGQGRYPLPALLAGAEFLVIIVALTGAVAALVLAVTGVAGGISSAAPVALYALTIPLVLQFAHLVPLLQARNQFRSLNAAFFSIPALTLGGIVALQAADALTVSRALGVWAGAYGVANLLAANAVGWQSFAEAFPFIPAFEVLRAQIRFGLQGELGNILQLVNYRFDQLVVAAYGGTADVGFYSIAVAVAESLWLISSAIVMVLTPRLTGATAADAAEFAAFVCRTVLWGNGMIALGLAAASPILIEAVFGDDGAGAVSATLWLLPGAVAMSGGLTLSSYVFSRGRPILNTVSTAATVVITLVADLALIPRFGIDGAAVASTIAYTVTFALFLFWYRRLSGVPARSAVILRPRDFPTYAMAGRAAAGRLRAALQRVPAP